MGSHVSAVPNHQTGRITSMNTRGVVAMTGAFGYELDLNKLTKQEQEQIKLQIKKYHELAPLIATGDYYRLSNPFCQEYSAWMVVNKEKSDALVSVVMLESHGNMPVSYIRLTGLDENAIYREIESGKEYKGLALMEAGIPITLIQGEYQAYQYKFEKVMEE